MLNIGYQLHILFAPDKDAHIYPYADLVALSIVYG